MSKALVELVHGDQRLPLRLNGAVLGFKLRDDGLMSLSADLRQPAIDVVQEGDMLVAP